MIPDFKIYVPVLNEESLINHTVSSLISVFPGNVEVIDLGSTDKTVRRVPKGVKVHTEPLPPGDPEVIGNYYTELKNKYSAKQPWVLWVDGDEIYPTSTLQKIRGIVERGGDGAVSHRLYWRILKQVDGRMCFSKEFLSAGSKLFHSAYQKFVRAWPKEVCSYVDPKYMPGGKGDFNGLWFWHGVLLTRTNSLEATGRRKKREAKENSYKVMTWVPFDVVPWNDGFKSEPVKEWTVFEMHPYKPPPGDIWTGTLNG